MAKRNQKKKRTPKPRDWNMVGLLVRSGGKGRHQSKKHKPRGSDKIALKKSLMGSAHGAFFMSSVWSNAGLLIYPGGPDRSLTSWHGYQVPSGD